MRNKDGGQRLHAMDKADKIVGRIFVFISLFSIAACAVILFSTVIDVVMQALANKPLKGAMELGTDMMVLVSFCALPVVTIFSGHITVDIVARRLPEAWQVVLKVFNLLVFSGICLLSSYATYRQALRAMQLGSRGSALKIPYYPFYIVISVMILIAVICALYNLVHLVVTGEEVNEDMLRIKAKNDNGEGDAQ